MFLFTVNTCLHILLRTLRRIDNDCSGIKTHENQSTIKWSFRYKDHMYRKKQPNRAKHIVESVRHSTTWSENACPRLPQQPRPPSTPNSHFSSLSLGESLPRSASRESWWTDKALYYKCSLDHVVWDGVPLSDRAESNPICCNRRSSGLWAPPRPSFWEPYGVTVWLPPFTGWKTCGLTVEWQEGWKGCHKWNSTILLSPTCHTGISLCWFAKRVWKEPASSHGPYRMLSWLSKAHSLSRKIWHNKNRQPESMPIHHKTALQFNHVFRRAWTVDVIWTRPLLVSTLNTGLWTRFCETNRSPPSTALHPLLSYSVTKIHRSLPVTCYGEDSERDGWTNGTETWLR